MIHSAYMLHLTSCHRFADILQVLVYGAQRILHTNFHQQIAAALNWVWVNFLVMPTTLGWSRLG